MSISNFKVGSEWKNPLSPPVYDDIVRRDQFRPDSEQKRDFRNNGFQGSTQQGVYDSQFNKDLDFESVSNEEIALRENRLDKAEVQVLKEQIQKDFDQSQKNDDLKEKLEKADKRAKARSDRIDATLGLPLEEDSSES